MSEEKEALTPEVEEKPKQAPLSEKKRTAMLRYIAILFAVAFALVMLSYLVQTRNSRTTIRELSATSMSALQNAEQLQETNRDLTEENVRLRDELDNANSVVQEYHESVAAECQGAHARGVDEGTGDTQAAYDLLLKALEAKDPEELKRTLDELEPLKDSLSDAAKARLEELKKTL